MKAVLVSPRTGLVAAVLERLRPRGKDYANAWVVFPEKRPGYHLRKALAAREGSAFIPPRVDSFDGFVDRVFEERLGRAAPLLDPLDAVKILHEIHSAGRAPLGGTAFLNPDDFFNLGLKMYRDLEDLAEAGTSPESLRELDLVAAEGRERKIPPRARGRLQSLSSFQEAFAAAVAECGLTTPAGRKAAVSVALGPDLFRPDEEIIFAGFFVLTEMEKRILRALAAHPSATFLFLEGKGIGAALAALGFDPVSVEGASSAGAPRPDFVFIKSPDTHGQAFALSGWLEAKSAEAGPPDDRSVVVLPAAESLFPVYHQTLAVLPEDGFNISMGYPLARTPLVTFFEHLFEVLRTRDDDGRVFGPRYLRFVLHPYAKNVYYRDASGERPEVTRVLFHAVEEHFARRGMSAFWSLDDLETDPSLWETVDELSAALEDRPTRGDLQAHLRAIHDNTLRAFAGLRDAAGFAERVIRVLEYVYSNSSARQHPFFHPFAEAFRDGFDRLAASLFGTTAFDDPASYFNLFRKVVALRTVPFAGTPLRGLQVLGFWETRGIPFEDVALLDANEGVLPAFQRSDTLLPYTVRKALGLPTYADLERRTAYHLDTLLRGARRVHVFYVENKDRERSRFVERLVWDLQKEGKEQDGDRFVRALQYRIDLRTAEPRPAAKMPETLAFLRDFRYSASSLNTYLACPLRFYNAHVLGLRERESLDDTLDAKAVGTLVHAVLEDVFRPFVGKTFGAADLKKASLRAALDRRFAERYGGEGKGGAFLLKHQIGLHLEEFLSGYQKDVLAGVPSRRIKLLELETNRDLRISFGSDEFPATIRADRIEERDGIVHILDYKIGASPRFHEIGFSKMKGLPLEELRARPRARYPAAYRSVQIPFYVLALSGLLGLAGAAVEGKIVLLGKAALNAKAEFSPLDQKSDKDILPRADKLAIMEAVIHGLLREINDPAVPFTAAEDPENCAGCPYAVTCGR